MSDTLTMKTEEAEIEIAPCNDFVSLKITEIKSRKRARAKRLMISHGAARLLRDSLSEWIDTEAQAEKGGQQ